MSIFPRKLEQPIEAAREERLARLTAETESSRAAIADANARAAELLLSLERIPPEHLGLAKSKLARSSKISPKENQKHRSKFCSLKEDGEALRGAIQLRDLLREAKWQASEPTPAPATDIARFANQPSHTAAGGQPVGVVIAVCADTQEEFRLIEDRQANTSINALYAALLKALRKVWLHTGGKEAFSVPNPE